MIDLAKIKIDNFEYLDETTSTSDVILAKAKNDEPEFSICLAEKQTNGRGRLKRVWQTFPYKSLAFSFSVYNFVDVMPLVLCCSLHSVLFNKYKAKVAIKWPNDIYSLLDKKISGILVESFPVNNKRVYIVGIGLNVFKQDCDLETVGFLEDTTDKDISREELLSDIFFEIKKDLEILNQEGFGFFKNYFMQHCLYLNKKIKVNLADSVKEGTFIGINDKGYLILKQKEVILDIPAGEIVQKK